MLEKKISVCFAIFIELFCGLITMHGAEAYNKAYLYDGGSFYVKLYVSPSDCANDGETEYFVFNGFSDATETVWINEDILQVKILGSDYYVRAKNVYDEAPFIPNGDLFPKLVLTLDNKVESENTTMFLPPGTECVLLGYIANGHLIKYEDRVMTGKYVFLNDIVLDSVSWVLVEDEVISIAMDTLKAEFGEIDPVYSNIEAFCEIWYTVPDATQWVVLLSAGEYADEDGDYYVVKINAVSGDVLECDYVPLPEPFQGPPGEYGIIDVFRAADTI